MFSPPVSADPTGAAPVLGGALIGLSDRGSAVSCLHAPTASGSLLIAPLPGPTTAAATGATNAVGTTASGAGSTTAVAALPAARALGVDIDAGPVTIGGGAAALLSAPLGLDADCSTSENLELAGLTPGGVVPFAQLARNVEVLGAAIAADARGDVAAAWIESSGAQVEALDTLWIAIRTAGSSTRGPIRLAQERSPEGLSLGLGSVAVGIDGAGRALVTYTTDSEVFAETLDPDGSPGERQVIGPCNENCSVALGEAPNGRAVIAWNSQSGSTEPGSPLAVLASVRGADDAPFGARQVIDPGQLENGDLDGPQAAIAADGTAIVEWNNSVGTNEDPDSVVRAAIAPAGRGFGPIIALAANGNPGTIAVRPDGEALITWVAITQVNSTSGPVHAILVPPGDTVAPRGVTLSGASGDFPLAEFTADGTPLVAWEACVGNDAAVGVSTHRR
ncbi:MAG TPA: hypothetical protein VG165_04280 [Solirubrobacteraceae bacterium]|nr:hypothetical protein [Solirubrobacteraceae bacterium]